ncbi:MAG TPA: hypothetical protein VJ912_01785 [Candidatus Nanoarchaeia archaeon]|nr:hypothetical protein [Candidatus Nanoarchaeia archaeon]
MTTKKETKEESPKKDNFETLINNFVSFQKVMTNLTEKFDKLSSQMSKLLELFEESARSLAEKDYKEEKQGKADKEEMEKKKEIVEKLESVLEQNKIIARGLTLMHEKIDENEQNVSRPHPNQQTTNQGFQGMKRTSPEPSQNNPQKQTQNQGNENLEKHYPMGPSTNPNLEESNNQQQMPSVSEQGGNSYKKLDSSESSGM